MPSSPPADAPRPAPARVAADARIVVEGRVQLGHDMVLEQGTSAPRRTRPRFAVGLPDDGSLPRARRRPALPPDGTLTTTELDWRLRPGDGDVALEDSGLTASYGIFGAPGSGKTYLLMHLVRQLVGLHADDPDRRFGGLVVDPKAAMVGQVTAAMEAVGRLDDLVVLNPRHLAGALDAVNIIDAGLSPEELGRVLVLAAQSAGVGASEPFWFGAWRNLFTAALPLLRWLEPHLTTLASLMDAVLVVEPTGHAGAPERRIQRIARDARHRLAELEPGRRRDMELHIGQVEGFYRQEPDNIATIEALMTAAYGGFRQSAWQGFSRYEPNVPGVRRRTFYDAIVDDGAVVLVAVGPSEAGMAKVLCTVVKLLFQRTVLSRLERVQAGTLQNFERPLMFVCDEYSDVASEVPGEAAGDAYFFSLARQFGCLGLVATQSVNMLEASSLKEHWRAVFANFSAKVFMRLADNETAEEANKLAGETDWYVSSAGRSVQKDGTSSSTSTELRERTSLPTAVLTQVLQRQQAVVVGSLSGGTRTGTWFVRVPDRAEGAPRA